MKKVVVLAVCLFYIFNLLSCSESGSDKIAYTNYTAPQYDLVSLEMGSDTLHFALNDTTYNNVTSLNVFNSEGMEYLAVHDGRSGSINFYNLQSQQLTKQIVIKKHFNNVNIERVTVFCASFDSIFLGVDSKMLYMFDSAGIVKRTINVSNLPHDVIDVRTSRPMVIKDSIVFAAFSPAHVLINKKDLNNWKMMYGINLKNNKGGKYYHLPQLYRENLFGFHFMHFSYCYNNHGKFVFSFPADPNIYETDLSGLQYIYYGKSRYQDGEITPVSNRLLKSGEGGRQYHIRDAYGAIYFDQFAKRYLRYFRQKVPDDSHFAANRKNPKESVVIFDEDLKIIGESAISRDVSFSSLFTTHSGKTYVRVNTQDENMLHFVELHYKERNSDQAKLIKK